MPSLKDRIAFVTGASAGFGAAIARRLVKEGAKVVLTARRTDRLEALAAELGDRAWPVALDVTEAGAVERVLAGLPDGFREVSILVNNAGLALGLGPAHEASLSDWQTMIDTNVSGLVRVTHALLPGLVARGGGDIVNLGSVAGTYPYPGGNVYAGSKAFVHQFSVALRADLLGKHVRVSCLEPGMCESEFSVVRFGGDSARAAKVYEGMQPITPDDIAETVAWILSLPKHVNVNALELMPVQQAFSPFAVDRSGKG